MPDSFRYGVYGAPRGRAVAGKTERERERERQKEKKRKEKKRKKETKKKAHTSKRMT
jgi:hypothetical protein